MVIDGKEPAPSYPSKGAKTEDSMLKSFFIAACLCVLVSPAVTRACDADPAMSMASLEAFVSGNWSGSGKFASGKDIAADVSFDPVPGGHWLAYEHKDRPPGSYMARGTWGYVDPAHFAPRSRNGSCSSSNAWRATG